MFFYTISVILIIFITANWEYLHWKTFYQTFLGQTFLTTILFFWNKQRTSHSRKEHWLLLFYIILLSSFITSTTEFFYKLGRKENSLDLFRYFVGLIPIIFFIEIRKKNFEKIGVFRFSVFSILLLSSISFNYTYFRIPELGFFLGIVLIILWIENKTEPITKVKSYSIFIIFILILHSCISYTSFTSLIIYSTLFLSALIFLVKVRLPTSYYFLILLLNLTNIIIFEIQTLGKLSFFQKISFPLLNSNRISNYYGLFLVIPLHYFLLSKRYIKKFLFSSLSIAFLILIALLLNYSRGLFISVIFVLLLYFTILWKRGTLRIIFLAFLFLLVLLPLYVHILVKLEYASLNTEDWSAGRFTFWNKFLEIFQTLSVTEKLIGLGIGEQNFFVAFVDSSIHGIAMEFIKETDGSLIHAHNLALSILFYFGLIGVFLYLLGLLFSFIKIHSANNKRVVYSFSFLIFMIHNIFDSLETTLSLVVILGHFSSHFFLNKRILIQNESFYLKLVFVVLCIFLLQRSYHYFQEHKSFSIQSKTWKDVRTCQFAYVPEISKINEKDKPNLSFFLFYFAELRRSQENLLYALKYYKKFPTKENYKILEETLKTCKKQHFKPILCDFYEKNKIAIILDYYDYFKRLDVYPQNEILKCFKN